MEYNTLKTRLKNKLIKEYKKSAHTEEYIETEKAYKKVRESITLLETEIQNLSNAFANTTVYENITSGLYTGIEKVKESLKRGQKQKEEATKEEPDVFSNFSACASTIAGSAKSGVAEKYDTLSHALKKVSSARIQFRDSLVHNLYIIKEMKETAKLIDEKRVQILGIRQTIEAERNAVEEEKAKREYEQECSCAYEQMKQFCSADELVEIATGISVTLKTFFGDSFDAMSGEDAHIMHK